MLGKKSTTEILSQIYLRDLEKIKTEIASYKNEENLWKTIGDIKNSAGNLSLHICGSLKHFIGTVLGKSGYVRKRDEEFSKKNVPICEFMAEIDLTINAVKKTLNELKEEDLKKTYPINAYGYEMTTGFFLTHLTTHLNYHLGQINYH